MSFRYATVGGAFYGLRGDEPDRRVETISPGGVRNDFASIRGPEADRQLLVGLDDALLVVSSTESEMAVSAIEAYFHVTFPVWRREIAHVRAVVGRPGGELLVVTDGFEDPPAFQVFDSCGEPVVERTPIEAADGASLGLVEVRDVPGGDPYFVSRADEGLRAATPGDALVAIAPEGCRAHPYDVTRVGGDPIWAWACVGESAVHIRGPDAEHLLGLPFQPMGLALAPGPGGTLVVATHDGGRRVRFEALDSSFMQVASGEEELADPQTRIADITLSAPVEQTLLVNLHTVVAGEIPSVEQRLIDVCPSEP